MPGTRGEASEFVADSGHVTDLAPWPHLFAVKVHFDPRVAGQHVAICAVESRHIAAQDVDHHCMVGAKARIPQGQVEDRTQMIFELASDGTIDGPMARVVRTHGQFVD